MVFLTYYLTEFFVDLRIAALGLEMSWDQFVVQEVPALSQVVQFMTIVPGDVAGFIVSVLSYVLMQRIYGSRPPINDAVRAAAWGNPHPA
ncbi:MAG: hypothetical protein B7Z55_18260 [Planctomycetales bacterium 12-60-4]|nr:MAG: hypothetical protein B7Z55_18260 [Planctomycetales bacterium 12-60-4]